MSRQNYKAETIITNNNKLSYRRETTRQLFQFQSPHFFDATIQKTFNNNPHTLYVQKAGVFDHLT